MNMWHMVYKCKAGWVKMHSGSGSEITVPPPPSTLARVGIKGCEMAFQILKNRIRARVGA